MNAHQALDLIVGQARRGELIFPTNMAASLRLQRALGDPGCHLETAAELVLAEPLIAARLVAIANSVAYTRFGGRVSNVRAAVSLLGFTPLRSLVAAIVVRQLASEIADAELRHKAELLWQHCATVAALAKVLAREFTEIDPETALFAGIVHEIDGFYLLSRAAEFPALFKDDPGASGLKMRAVLVRCILQTLKIPRPVGGAVESLFDGSPVRPPVTVDDVLSLANTLAAVASPLAGWGGIGAETAVGIPDFSLGIPDFSRDGKTLTAVLESAADEIRSITESLLL
ncbi:MAG: HDOD domain-containing protein [Gammaproteobacteria bacterium]|nr:HDOD domain-containing protein [Rhodocyclaceae bacterium]MBU3910100.1 HDOD domain-containing protein [Gammaproteobacteria bacterium]MBU3990112.1 HDOD domain-containing protein [Gammaproteobacteria bacterium]MBU4006108.1 HDOD domain-containing protein [Gammaproteobacteria bacterium]MBU4022562.1 HDOD domain-containing protein [Gammaproteobacteria bacterium]